MTPFDSQPPSDGWVGDERSGRAPSWWLRVASAGWDLAQATVEQREAARRNRLAAWIILGLIVALLCLAPLIYGSPSTTIAFIAAGVGLLVAVVLNRSGLTAASGVLIVALVCGAVLGALVTEPGGLILADLPSYDLLALAVLVAASILPRRMAFVVAAFNVALIVGDFLLQPHGADLQRYIATYPSAAGEVLALLARPVALQVIIAVVAYLWVRGTDDSISRADRAEEIAAMEHDLAEQKRQLEIGIRQILDAHVRVANGDLNARAPLNQDNVLYQIASALNNLLNRMARSVQAEHYYQRTLAEIARLRDSLLAIRAGRAPLWPAPSGTPVDGLIEVLAGPGRPGPTSNFPAMGPQAFPGAPSGGVPGLPGAPSGGSGRFPGAPGGAGPVSAGGTSSDFTGFPPRVQGSGPTPRGPISGPGARRGPISRPRPGGPSGGGAPRDWGTPPSGTPPEPSPNPWDMPPLPDWPPPEEPEAQG